ncbi:DNA polymerase IV [Vreelandella venusta]|uniref:DNA polymerase IV n=1 Tax=Vreelandella venusta TaxID=44935 RepID=A0AAP9ZFN0_9GAMM|nr:DNA polymerase IV [Halomonas venusta]AZM94782.1 DNA polymerase IV [Halomonas venusta]NPT29277.1 DNA polymerase IV [Halomonas venusta]QRL04008.1 DNA polymerase IV [Halomonas venusta]GEK51934.1 DNA polymerase IV [Halomonas venusta]
MRKIIHCDCDCFYAAVEMRDNPALNDVPIAIGGSVEQRGVVATCNYPAREFGIHSAMPMAQALKRCPHLTVIRGDMAKYKAVARQVFAIYRDVTELIEPLSLDEAFLDVTDVSLCNGSATRMAEAIRQRVKQEVGITVSAGVAPNKFLAKIASDWRKPDGLFVITPNDIDGFVQQLPVKKIHGVGPRTAEKLAGLGIQTCADLRARPLTELVEQFGRFGHRLFELSFGRDERPVKTHRERKSISTEQTYSQDLPTLETCRQQIPDLLNDLEQRYARLDPAPAVRGLMVKIKFNDFTQTTVEHADPAPNQEQFESLLAIGWARGEKPVRLLGVGYRLAEEAAVQQLSLF